MEVFFFEDDAVTKLSRAPMKNVGQTYKNKLKHKCRRQFDGSELDQVINYSFIYINPNMIAIINWIHNFSH